MHRPLWYRRDGTPFPDGAYADIEKCLHDVTYKRVAQTTLPDGTWISTVWLGIDHGFMCGASRPIIFETMVFRSKTDMTELDIDRYATEAEARAGHEAMVAKWHAKIHGER